MMTNDKGEKITLFRKAVYIVTTSIKWSIPLSVILYSLLLTSRATDIESDLILSGSRRWLAGEEIYSGGFFYPIWDVLLWFPLSYFDKTIWFYSGYLITIISMYLLTLNLYRTVLLMSFPPIMWNLNTGQVDHYVIFFFALSMTVLVVLEQPILYGIILSLTLVKPQFGLPILGFVFLYMVVIRFDDIPIGIIIGTIGIMLVSIFIDHLWLYKWWHALEGYRSLATSDESVYPFPLSVILSFFILYDMRKFISFASISIVALTLFPISHAYDASLLAIPLAFAMNSNKWGTVVIIYSFSIAFHLFSFPLWSFITPITILALELSDSYSKVIRSLVVSYLIRHVPERTSIM